MRGFRPDAEFISGSGMAERETLPGSLAAVSPSLEPQHLLGVVLDLDVGIYQRPLSGLARQPLPFRDLPGSSLLCEEAKGNGVSVAGL